MQASLRALPIAHKITLGIALAILAMAGYLFVIWVSTPTYALLYSGLDDSTLSEVVAELDQKGVDYKLEGGGSRVLVPQSDVYTVRAQLNASGVKTSSTQQGYELLDEQGLNVSDFRQHIDYQRALEGELAKTLTAMDPIAAATVHLVIPEAALFASEQEPVKASVLIESARQLSALEVETVTFVVSSAVEGLEPTQVTVADATGTVLQAAGDIAAGTNVTNRNLRMTRDFEMTLAADVEHLLGSAIGPDLATVVVRADLDFDELATESESFDPESAVVIKQQRVDETFSGTGAAAGGGVIGVDGNVPTPGEDLDSYDYSRSEVIEETGIDRTVTRTVRAPGRIRALSVAVVMDDGSLTGATVPAVTEIESLVTAAMGLDTARGDSVAVSSVPFPAPEEIDDATAAGAIPSASDPMTGMIPQAAGAAVLLLVAIALLWMTRRSKRQTQPLIAGEAAALPAGTGAGPAPALARPTGASHTTPDVAGLIERQPEEIAVLLRGWLADRR